LFRVRGQGAQFQLVRRWQGCSWSGWTEVYGQFGGQQSCQWSGSRFSKMKSS